MKKEPQDRQCSVGGADIPCDTPLAREYAELVNKLCAAIARHKLAMEKSGCPEPLPSRDAVVSLVEALRSVLFPGYFGTSEASAQGMPFYIGGTLDRISRKLREQVQRGMCFACEEPDKCRYDECTEKARAISRKFLSKLPEIQGRLSADVQATYEGDPAATSTDEVIFCYPGLQAIINYRMAHELHMLEVPFIPRMMTEYAHSTTGIDIHPGAQIGESFFIDHGTGVVIGETCRIGDRVRIYQGVTLGAKSFPLDENGCPIKNIERHPIVEDDVVIYSGATILGRIVIGKGSVIGANVWLTHSVEPGSRVSRSDLPEKMLGNKASSAGSSNEEGN